MNKQRKLINHIIIIFIIACICVNLKFPLSAIAKEDNISENKIRLLEDKLLGKRIINKEKIPEMKTEKVVALQGIVLDSKGYLYIGDNQSHCVWKFDSNGNLISKWDSALFYYPFGVAVDSKDNIYVADHVRGLMKFDSQGNLIKYFEDGLKGKQIIYYKEDNPVMGFIRAEGVTVGPGDYVYVIGAYGFAYKFTSDGNLIKRWDIDSEGNKQKYDSDKYYHGITVDENGNIYIIDVMNYCIKKFNNDGELLLQWGKEGKENGEFKDPRGISVDSSGYVYIVDTRKHEVQKFSSSGRYISKAWNGEYFVPSMGERYMSSPRAITVDDKGNIYVADNNGVSQLVTNNFK